MTADDVRARFEAWSKGNNLDLMTNWREDDLALVSVGTLMKLAAHADLSGEVREWQPEETAPDSEFVDVWVGGTENGFRYANAVKLGGVWCDRNGYRLTLKGIRLWIKPPADPALAKFTPQEKER